MVAESPPYSLRSVLGTVVTFRLAKRLPVAAGDAIALTVPTWAPVLSVDMRGYAHRQSLSGGCQDVGQSLPPASQLRAGDSSTFHCSYQRVRVEYSATEATR